MGATRGPQLTGVLYMILTRLVSDLRTWRERSGIEGGSSAGRAAAEPPPTAWRLDLVEKLLTDCRRFGRIADHRTSLTACQ